MIHRCERDSTALANPLLKRQLDTELYIDISIYSQDGPLNVHQKRVINFYDVSWNSVFAYSLFGDLLKKFSIYERRENRVLA